MPAIITPAYPPGELLVAARAQCVLLGATRVDARVDARTVLCGSLLVLWCACMTADADVTTRRPTRPVS